MSKGKLQMKERNIEMHVPPGFGPTHREVIEMCRSGCMEIKSWYKFRHDKKEMKKAYR